MSEKSIKENLTSNNFSSKSSKHEKKEESKDKEKKDDFMKGKKIPTKKRWSSPLIIPLKKENKSASKKAKKNQKTEQTKQLLVENIIQPENNISPKSQKNVNDSINTFETKNSNNKNIQKKQLSHLSLYEREKRHIIRKKNFIKKKKELALQQEQNNLRSPNLDDFSMNIISQNGNYVPIQDRAAYIYNMKQIHYIINKDKEIHKKNEKEKEEILKLKIYNKKKPFDQNDWNNFIESQEYWYRRKFLKKKAIELMRENIEIKLRHKPKINNNSKRIVYNKIKRKEYGNDIYDKLYNDFINMQERKQLKICNSMPSFKPLLNKGINKRMFQSSKLFESSKNHFNKSIEKQIESVIQRKLKSLKNKDNLKSNKTFTNILEDIKLNFNVNKKNDSIKNKRYENINNKSYYNDKTTNYKSMDKTHNISKDSYLYKHLLNRQAKKKN